MKKTLSVVIPILVVTCVAVVYFTSNLSRRKATAVFSHGKDQTDGMNTLTVEAPYGYYVIRYDVVPKTSGEGRVVFQVGGRGMAQKAIGLFGNDRWHSSNFPSEGESVDIPLETHVRIAPDLNLAATAGLPADKTILERCGQYLFITKDRDQYDNLESIVSK